MLFKSFSLGVERAVRYILNAHKLQKKIGFWINEEYTYDHYKNVLMLLDKNKFELILDDKFKSNVHLQFMTLIRATGWSFVYFGNVLDVKKYSFLITHLAFGEGCINLPSLYTRFGHIITSMVNVPLRILGKVPFSVGRKQYFQRRLGLVNFRFMYGADLTDRLWPSNGLYDMFFCHGPNDAEEMRRLHLKPTLIMGYPRYDRFFDDAKYVEKLISIKRRLGCSPYKPNILWISTVSTEFSTIETYAPAIAELTKIYNVILRPHPLEIDTNSTRYKENIREIADSGTFLSNTKFFDDLCELYLVADIVLIDYGGTIFSALYLDKKILLLNHPNAKDDIGIMDSNSMDARQFLPSIDPEDSHKIGGFISDEAFWSSWRDRHDACRLKYFGKSRGNSAKVVAKYLNNLCLSK